MPPQPVEVAETPAFAAVAAGVDRASPEEGFRSAAASGSSPRTSCGSCGSSFAARSGSGSPGRSLTTVGSGPCSCSGFVTVTFRARTGWAVWHDAAEFLLLGWGPFSVTWCWSRAWQEAWRHARDARIGRVAIVRYPLIDDEAPMDAPARFITMELLPVSEEVWTVDGEPAGWRTIQ